MRDDLNRCNQSFAAQTLAKNQLLYPNEYVVRFLSHLGQVEFPGREGLDIGFGSGQHLQLLMDYGYRASGIELVPEAGARAQSLFCNNPRFGNIFVGDFRTLNLPTQFYDVIICWGVAFLRPLPDVIEDLKYVRSLLKSTGYLCINFRTKDNWFYGLGEQLEHEHFLLDKRARSYAGAHYTFMDEPMVRQVLQDSNFIVKNFERWDWQKNNMKEQHSWWIAWATADDTA